MAGGILLPGNATTAQVLSGKTFSSGAAGFNATGTLGANALALTTEWPLVEDMAVEATRTILTTAGTCYNLGSISLGAGAWVVNLMANFGEGGTFTTYISLASASPTNVTTALSANQNGTILLTVAVNLTTATTLYFNATGSSGSSGNYLYWLAFATQVA